MKTKDFCQDCGILLTKTRNGLCPQCEKGLKEKMKKWSKIMNGDGKYDRNLPI